MIKTLNPVYGGKPDGEVHINELLEDKIIKGIKKYLLKNNEHKTNIERLNYYFTGSLDNKVKWLGNITLKEALKTVKKRAKRNNESYELNATYLSNKSQLVDKVIDQNNHNTKYSYWIGDFNEEKCMAGDELTNVFYKRLVYKVTAR